MSDIIKEICLYFGIVKSAFGDDKEGYAKARRDFDSQASSIADALSRFRRNFYASPFEKAFNALLKGTVAEKMEYSQHVGDCTWVIPQETQVSVFFALHFKEVTDQCLIRLILNVHPQLGFEDGSKLFFLGTSRSQKNRSKFPGRHQNG